MRSPRYFFLPELQMQAFLFFGTQFTLKLNLSFIAKTHLSESWALLFQCPSVEKETPDISFTQLLPGRSVQACDLLAKRPLPHPPRPLILSKLDQKGRNQDHKGFKALPDFYRTKGHVHNKAELPSVLVRRYHSDPTSSSLHPHALPPPGSEGSQVTAGEKGPQTPVVQKCVCSRRH